MSDLWQRLSETKVLDDAMRSEIKQIFGARGKKALAAIDEGKVRKYLDFFVVDGATAEYVLEEDFCTCGDFIFRGRECWHLLAVRIAQATGTFKEIPRWYQDRWKK